MYSKFKKFIFLVIFLFFCGNFFLATNTYAVGGVPSIISYQGHLTDSGGNALGGVGTSYFFKFSFWDSPTVDQGNKLWPSTSPSSVPLIVKQGVFSVNIGDTLNGYPDTLNYDFNTNSRIYLQVEISSDNETFETLTPRSPITSSSFAQVADRVSGTAQSSFGTTTPITNSVITAISTAINSTVMTIKGLIGQVANLFNIQDSSGNSLFAVTAGGNVGVGTASPDVKLSVSAGSSSTEIDVGETGSSRNILRLMANPGGTSDQIQAIKVGSNFRDLRTDSNTLQFYTGYYSTAERMRIDSTGNVGIGTTSPAQKLDVNGKIRLQPTSGTYPIDISNGLTHGGLVIESPLAATAAFRLLPAGNSIYFQNTVSTGDMFFTGLNASDLTGAMHFQGTGTIDFGGSSSKRLTILSNGNVGIGTTSPLAKLDVAGDVYADRLLVGDTATPFPSGIEAHIQGDLGISGSFGFIGAGTHNFKGFSTGTNVNWTYWDGSADQSWLYMKDGGNIGIGTTSPTSKLTVDGTTALLSSVTFPSGLSIDTAGRISDSNGDVIFNDSVSMPNQVLMAYMSGNVGIGTTDPEQKLDVRGRLQIKNDYPFAKFQTTNDSYYSELSWANAAGNTRGFLKYDFSNDALSVRTGGSGEALRITSTGNVGIGTTPSRKLHISGIGWEATPKTGDLLITGTGLYGSTIGLESTDTGGHLWNLFSTGSSGLVGAGAFTIRDDTDAQYRMVIDKDGNFAFGEAITDAALTGAKMVIKNTGNVGVGITTPTSKIHGVATLSAAAGNEVAYSLDYTTNKATSGDDTGLQINFTDTASPGDSKVLQVKTNGVEQWFVRSNGQTVLNGTGSLYTPGVFINGGGSINSSGDNQNIFIYNRNHTGTANQAAITLALGTWSNTAGTGKNVLISPTYNQVGSTAANTDLEINRIETSVGSGAQYLIDAKVGGVSKFNISNIGQGYFAGNVGIGTTSPFGRLSITQSANSEAGGIFLAATGGQSKSIYMDSSNILHFVGNGVDGTLNDSGVWTDSSDISYKNNISDIKYGLDTVRLLQPHSYTMKGSGAEQIGFIAQEVEKIIPEVVSGEEGHKGIAYGQITAVAIRSIQQLDEKISQIFASIKDGIMSVAGLVVGSKDKPSGITLYDEVSGEPYCLKVRNGATVTLSGECGTSQTTVSTPVIDSPTETSTTTPPVIEVTTPIDESNSTTTEVSTTTPEAEVVESVSEEVASSTVQSEPVAELVPVDISAATSTETLP